MLSLISHRTKVFALGFGLLLAFPLLLSADDRGTAEPPVIHYGELVTIESGAEGKEVDLYEGQLITLKLDKRIRSISGVDTDFVSVLNVESDKFTFSGGQQSGRTTLQIRDVDDTLTQIAITVKDRGTVELQRALRELFPETKFELYELGSSILIRGSVSTTRDFQQISDIAGQFYGNVLNHLTVDSDFAKSKPTAIPRKSPEKTDLQSDIRALHADVKRLIELLEQRQSSTKTDPKHTPGVTLSVPALGPTPPLAAPPSLVRPARAAQQADGNSTLTQGAHVLFFYADWSPMSKEMMSLVESIANNEAVKVVQIAVQGHRMTAKRFGVSEVPTLLSIADGKELQRVTGMTDEEKLRQMIRRVKQREYDYVWNAIGLRLAPPAPTLHTQMSKIHDFYRGGMLVTEVCEEFPRLEETGIQVGDIIVALGISETRNISDVRRALLEDCQFDDSGKLSIKYHAVRDKETLQGELQIATAQDGADRTDDPGEEILPSTDSEVDGTVLLFFEAGWCVPCQQMMPVIREVEKEGLGRVRIVDIDKDRALAEKYGVTSLPTLVLVCNGEEVHRRVGFVTADEVRELLRTARNGVFTFHVGFTR